MELQIEYFQKIRKLPEICSQVFSLILQLRASDDYGESETLREKIISLLGKQTGNNSIEPAEKSIASRGKELRFEPEDIEDTIFALTAFIDETIASSNWSQKDQWLARRLQLELFSTANAGEEFFLKLEKLQQQVREKAPLLEVYYLCLNLGFEGKYKILGKDQLKMIIDQLASDLKLAKFDEANVLSPKWKRGHDIIRVVRDSGIPTWVVFMSCFLVATVIFWAASSKIDKFAGHVKNKIVQVINRTR